MNSTFGRARSAVLEFLVIVTGVLVALAVDEWREARREAYLELEYAERLKADLQRDIDRFSGFEQGRMSPKVDVLMELARGSASMDSANLPSPLASLEYSTYVALPETQAAVFREMETNGHLRLLEDPDLRRSLAAYYAFHQLMYDISAESFGPYREVVTSAFPGDLFYSSRVDSVAVSDADVQAGLQALLAHPQLESAVNSELHYSAFLVLRLRLLQRRAQGLLDLLNEQYPS